MARVAQDIHNYCQVLSDGYNMYSHLHQIPDAFIETPKDKTQLPASIPESFNEPTRNQNLIKANSPVPNFIVGRTRGKIICCVTRSRHMSAEDAMP